MVRLASAFVIVLGFGAPSWAQVTSAPPSPAAADAEVGVRDPCRRRGRQSAERRHAARHIPGG